MYPRQLLFALFLMDLNTDDFGFKRGRRDAQQLLLVRCNSLFNLHVSQLAAELGVVVFSPVLWVEPS